MARSTRLVILIKNIYTLWGRKRFLLPLTYFPTNLEDPFTLRVTGIKITHRPTFVSESVECRQIIRQGKRGKSPNICLSLLHYRFFGSLLRCADFSADVNSGRAFRARCVTYLIFSILTFIRILLGCWRRM